MEQLPKRTSQPCTCWSTASIPGFLESGSKTNILDVGALCFAVIPPIKVSVPSCVISNSWSLSEDRNPLLHSVNKVLGIVLYFLQEAWREWLLCSCRNIDQQSGENSMFPCTSSCMSRRSGIKRKFPFFTPAFSSTKYRNQFQCIDASGGWLEGDPIQRGEHFCHHIVLNLIVRDGIRPKRTPSSFQILLVTPLHRDLSCAWPLNLVKKKQRVLPTGYLCYELLAGNPSGKEFWKNPCTHAQVTPWGVKFDVLN